MKITQKQLRRLIHAVVRRESKRIHEKAKPVDYKKAYKKYHSSPKAKKQRAKRNKIGRLLKKLLKDRGMEIPAGYEIDHIVPLDAGGTNDLSNIRLVPRGYNRRRGQEITTKKRKRNGTYKKGES
tara:strand:- start:1327 stop:1701 length:375 start_codon:yes stop_codon:yes gene_type:complete